MEEEDEIEESAKGRSSWSSFGGSSHEPTAWFDCANRAKGLGLFETAIECQKRGVKAYEKVSDFHSAKKYSENFGFTELAEYYQKIIDLRASRPK